MRIWVFQLTFYLLIACASSLSQAQAIRVDDTFTANDLVQNVLTNSACIAAQNATATGDDFSGIKKSYAYFNRNGSNFPFEEGIVLSTSSSINAIGPYNNSEGEGDARWQGDLDLQQALGRTKTVNATVLEFDFTALTNTISFNYLFASNEYQLYFPCEFSDGFAFLIKEVGSTQPYQNIAVIPNTNVPVSSTNIRPIIPPFNNGTLNKPGCEALNQQYFAGYNNNTSAINYSAQTVVLNAQTSVVAGRKYHIKLVIADDSNEKFDSAVFIEAGSFQPIINLGSEQTVCKGEIVVLDTGFNTTSYQYQWFKNGATQPILGANQPSLLVSDSGDYSVNVTLDANGTATCIATGSTTVNYKPSLATSLKGCGDSTNQCFFDLGIAKRNLQVSAASTITFYTTYDDYQQRINPIANENTYYSGNITIYARINNSAGSCQDYAEIQLTVLPLNTNIPTITLCDNDNNQDGKITVLPELNLTPKIPPSIVFTDSKLTYYLSQNDAAAQQNQIVDTFTTFTNPQTLFVRIENNGSCSGIYQLEVNVALYSNTTNTIIENILVNDFSNDNSITISTKQSGLFEYSVDGKTFQASPNFSNLMAGKYFAFVRDLSNCTIDSRAFVLLDYPKFFTPNGDGFNDSWQIKNLDSYPNAKLSIFDRYGKLVKEVSGKNATWNGIYNGELLPSSDYWFQLVLEPNSIIKGHFSLKR